MKGILASGFFLKCAEPQTMSIRFSLPAPHPFQKCSKAVMKPERGVSIHGSSSMNTTCRLLVSFFSSKDMSASNASSQSVGTRLISLPYLMSEE